jgi:NADPH2:quinone reductase
MSAIQREDNMTYVENVAVGDRVAYALGPLGSYAAGRLYPANRLVKLPDAISFEDAAAVVFKGITAQYLIKSTFAVGPGTVVLLYGAARALGQLLAPWAKHLGASVVGVVSKEASIARAKAAGCGHVLVWSDNLPADVARVTNGHKADVIYDGIGRKTFAASLDSLHQRGTPVSIGASSGSPPPLEVGTLNAKGSLFLTLHADAYHGSHDDRHARAFSARRAVRKFSYSAIAAATIGGLRA